MRDKDEDGYFSGADRTAPETSISRALREHGNTVKKINGIIHGVDPEGNVSPPIGTDVRKLKDWLGYAKGGLVKKSDKVKVVKMAKGGMKISPRKAMAMGKTPVKKAKGGMVRKGCK